MGIESFYINIAFEDRYIQHELIDEMICSNNLYKDYINYYFDSECEELCLQASMVCFFPMCEMFFELCVKINQNYPILHITSRRTSRPYDFNDSLDFFCWMYSLWVEKLNYFRKNFGDFLINPTMYYKSRRKLKKYYIKS